MGTRTGFLGLLGLLLIALKLSGTINWSWWLVLLPLYGPPAFWLLVVITGFGALFIGLILSTLRRRPVPA